MDKLLDGKELSKQLRGEIAQCVSREGVVPGLATVLVGDNPASLSYIKSKTRASEKAGFHAEDIRLPASISQEDLCTEIQKLNDRIDIHGILVQQPLPDHIDTEAVVAEIHADKDVDGFHPVNLGRLVRGIKGFLPCTPFGVCWMLDSADIQVSGKQVAIVGRSLLVGKPLAAMLMAKGGPTSGVLSATDATVTVCHSRTKDIASVTRDADIVICALGKPGFLTAEMVSDGAVVIDVGINRVEDSSRESGYRLVGDVAFDSVAEKASKITPVPGGVGPMTVTMLLYNTLQAARGRYSQDSL